MDNEPTNYEKFEKYKDMWMNEFMVLIEKMFSMNAKYNQNLIETKKHIEKLFKGIMNSYHVVEKYHRLSDIKYSDDK